MELVRIGLLALAGMWAFQIGATWVQMRHYKDVILETAGAWQSGFLGVGISKSRIGAGAAAIVVISDDYRVREVLSMSGLSVFARFKRIPEFIGGSSGEFQQAVVTSRLSPRIKQALREAFSIACTAAKDGKNSNFALTAGG